MEEMTIEGVNEGKPITIERINLEALEIIGPLKDLPKNEQMKSLRVFVMAALISSNNLTIQPTDPRYKDKIEAWARRMRAEDAVELSDKFLKANEAFLSKRRIQFHTPPLETSPGSNTPSV